MFEMLAGFFKVFSMAQSIAQVALPALAVMRQSQDPTVSNAGISNTLKVIAAVSPVVQAVEAHAAAGGAPMSGADKLATAQAVVQSAHDALAASGEVSQPFEAYWPLANAAITAICASQKKPV